MNEIARRLQVDPSTASRTIRPLADLGLAERHEDPADRRSIVVRASKRGRELDADFDRQRRGLMREIIGRLEPSRRVLLAELLEEFRGAHEQLLAENAAQGGA